MLYEMKSQEEMNVRTVNFLLHTLLLLQFIFFALVIVETVEAYISFLFFFHRPYLCKNVNESAA